MTKPGDEYQDLVGLVREALDPNATVKVGEWIEGPDGRRDMDVEVRGKAGGEEQFILVECKDWKRPVGIEIIDALESKRRDLNSNLAVIYSNSGFTQPALNKARRVGIQAFSALKENDKRVRLSLYDERVALSLSVDAYSIRVFFNKGVEIELPKGWTPNDVYYCGCPLVNYLHLESYEILRNITNSTQVKINYLFFEPQEFVISGVVAPLIGMEAILECKRRWISQQVRVGVTLGHYDHLKKKITIPNNQGYYLGNFNQDPEKWKEVEEGWKEEELEPDSFMLRMTIFNPVAKIKDADIPSIEDVISERKITFS